VAEPKIMLKFVSKFGTQEVKWCKQEILKRIKKANSDNFKDIYD